MSKTDFATLIGKLDHGRIDWASEPIRSGDELIIAAGGFDWSETYKFHFTDERLRQLVDALARAGVPEPLLVCDR